MVDRSHVARIVVNGRPREVAAEETVADLLRAIGLDARTVAVERNGEILARGSYGETRLGDGDRIEVVRFVQGG